jgi:hypothetical protein
MRTWSTCLVNSSEIESRYPLTASIFHCYIATTYGTYMCTMVHCSPTYVTSWAFKYSRYWYYIYVSFGKMYRTYCIDFCDRSLLWQYYVYWYKLGYFAVASQLLCSRWSIENARKPSRAQPTNQGKPDNAIDLTENSIMAQNYQAQIQCILRRTFPSRPERNTR